MSQLGMVSSASVSWAEVVCQQASRSPTVAVHDAPTFPQSITVVGISPDSPEKLAKFVQRDALTFPLVSDADKSVLTAYGAYGEKKNYGKTVMGVIRSTFVIDEQGKIQHAFYNVKATGHVAKLRRDLGID